MKRSTPLVILIAVATAIALAATWLILNRGPPRRRDRRQQTTSHPLPPFHLIAVERPRRRTLVAGTTAERVAVDSRRRGAATVRALEVRDDTLTIHRGDHRRWWRSLLRAPPPPTITSDLPQLDGIASRGNVRLTGDDRFAVPALASRSTARAACASPDSTPTC